MYLSAELEVDHDDADLGAGHHQDDEHQEQEPKQVVELVLPDGLQGATTQPLTQKHNLKPVICNLRLTRAPNLNPKTSPHS